MSEISIAEVVARANDAAFGRPLVTNVLRSQIVEAMIALAIEPEWKWCSADYAAWDFEHPDGYRLEVKQSSYLQTWAPPAHGKVNPGFDIAARKGRWEGARWIDEAGRAAHVYVLAYHDLRDASADHRNPVQWEFDVIPTTKLPATKRIGLRAVRGLANAVGISDLKNEIASAASECRR